MTELVPAVQVEIVVISTSGDREQKLPLSEIGVKGLFTKELDLALLDGSVDLTVNSLKDIPTEQPEEILLAAVPEREDPSDALVSKGGVCLNDLSGGAVVATGSLRRRAQLKALRPDLCVVDIRGNVDTRLRKLNESTELSGIILAYAGLRRLGLQSVVTEVLSPERWLPAPGQGALGILARSCNSGILEMVSLLDDPATRAAVIAERALLARLEGGCHVPVGAFGRIVGDELVLDAIVASLDGRQVVRGHISGERENAKELGILLAERLLNDGGDVILQGCERRSDT